MSPRRAAAARLQPHSHGPPQEARPAAQRAYVRQSAPGTGCAHSAAGCHAYRIGRRTTAQQDTGPAPGSLRDTQEGPPGEGRGGVRARGTARGRGRGGRAPCCIACRRASALRPPPCVRPGVCHIALSPRGPEDSPNYVTGGHRLARHRTPAGVGSHRQRRDDQTPTFPRAPAPPRSRPLHPLVPPPRPGPDAKLPPVDWSQRLQIGPNRLILVMNREW